MRAANIVLRVSVPLDRFPWYRCSSIPCVPDEVSVHIVTPHPLEFLDFDLKGIGRGLQADTLGQLTSALFQLTMSCLSVARSIWYLIQIVFLALRNT